MHGFVSTQEQIICLMFIVLSCLHLQIMSTSPDRGWAWLVLLGSVGEHIVMGYLAYASGMIHIALLENFNADVLTTTCISALFLALMTGSGK